MVGLVVLSRSICVNHDTCLQSHWAASAALAAAVACWSGVLAARKVSGDAASGGAAGTGHALPDLTGGVELA